MGPSSAGWASLVKDTPSVAWLPCTAAASPKDLFPCAAALASGAVTLQPPLSSGHHCTVIDRASDDQHLEDAQQGSEARGRLAERQGGAKELSRPHAEACGLDSRTVDQEQEAAVRSAALDSHPQEANEGLISPSPRGYKELGQDQEEALINAGLLSPASQSERQDVRDAAERGVALARTKVLLPETDVRADDLQDPGQNPVGGLLNLGAPVVAAASSSCGRSRFTLNLLISHPGLAHLLIWEITDHQALHASCSGSSKILENYSWGKPFESQRMFETPYSRVRDLCVVHKVSEICFVTMSLWCRLIAACCASQASTVWQLRVWDISRITSLQSIKLLASFEVPAELQVPPQFLQLAAHRYDAQNFLSEIHS